jgi:23S rRNA (adenine2503-C2)-methyltransferase
MTSIPKAFRSQLTEHFTVGSLALVNRQVSMDGVIKYLWKLANGHSMESVFIPEDRRTTICISSQVGCALGCGFCATAKMGFLDNLSAGEIVEQVIRVQQDAGEKITNVVFMGMGEPFLNYSRVIQASSILSDPEGLAIAAKKITISTVGVVPRIYQFAEEKQPFSLAISLHAPSQELRRQFMPIADKFPLDQLMESARFFTRQYVRKRITFEYVLLENVNDSAKEAKELLKLLSPLRCKLNLIPYNDTGLGFHRPSPERIEQFKRELLVAPFTVTLRKNRGNDISAACGQLFFKNKESKSPRFIANQFIGSLS